MTRKGRRQAAPFACCRDFAARIGCGRFRGRGTAWVPEFVKGEKHSMRRIHGAALAIASADSFAVVAIAVPAIGANGNVKA